MRSYSEYCALAKALDVVGDRWTLLIVRELELQGSCRYTDLRRGLPGIATNLLADRLRELEAAGLIQRTDAPPPVAATLFALTERGARLRPVLVELVRWGIPMMTVHEPDEAVRSHWLAFAIDHLLVDREPARPPVTIEVDTGDEPFVISVRDGTVRAHPGRAETPHATLSGPPNSVLGFVFGFTDREGLPVAGVTLAGDPQAIERIRLPAAERDAVFAA